MSVKCGRRTLAEPNDEVDVEAQAPESDFMEPLYKYTCYDSAEKILTNRTLKVTRASELNEFLR